MNCCANPIAAQFDRRKAEEDLRRYRRQGPDPTTRLLLAELRRWPLEGATMLDIGGGIGVIGAELADVLDSTTHLEAAPAYLEVARRELIRRLGADRARFLEGDFVRIADTVPAADVVTLDRVVCCYADGIALLGQAAAKARHLLALSYPRAHWHVRFVVWLSNLWRRVTGNPYRGFVHAPARLKEQLEQAGLVQAGRRGTIAWLVDVYRRPDTRERANGPQRAAGPRGPSSGTTG
jgi:predicted TPR repeat methyltransferase